MQVPRLILDMGGEMGWIVVCLTVSPAAASHERSRHYTESLRAFSVKGRFTASFKYLFYIWQNTANTSGQVLPFIV